MRLTDRAIALAPDSARAYLVKSQYLSFSNRASEGLGVADSGLVMNPNDAHLLAARAFAEIALGRFEQAKTDFQPAMRLSPRDPAIAQWNVSLGLAEFGLGHFDAAVEAFQRSINFGNRTFVPYGWLAAAHALGGDMDAAKSAMAEARRFNPRLTVKLMMSIAPDVPGLGEGLRKAGLTDPAPAP